MKYQWSTLRSMACSSLILLTVVGCNNQVEQQQHETTDVSPAKAVLQRTTGLPLTQLTTERVTDSADEWFNVQVKDNHMTVRGNSEVSIAYGAYQYLRDQGALSVSWEGTRSAIPDALQNYSGDKQQTPFSQRAYLNVCAYGYTTPWWDWARWEQEIDWMALHGVNNPVAMEGQEFVWQQLWKEFGVSDASLASYFSGPAFTPWQRMGNIEGHQPPLPQSWINKKYQLQVKILKRMQALGMEPVVPAFAGYVPKAFAEQHPEAKIYPMPKWTGFDNETYWLDPADPLFAKVAKRFIELYTDAYGEHKYYLSDAFNEMLPPVNENSRSADLASYGKRLYDAIDNAAPGAVWVMQGWMFGADSEFWDLESIDAFLEKVPDGGAMIHDIGNDRYHVWQRTEGFKGKPWIFGFIHNYGGSDPVYGDFSDYVEQLNVVMTSEKSGALSGFGVFPEGINNNSVVYEFLYDLPWQQQPDISDWVRSYTQARYGSSSDELVAAWTDLIDGVFSVRYWRSRWWKDSAGAYLLFKRPTTAITEFDSHPGNEGQLRKALKALRALATEYSDSSLFLYDLVDFTKHAVSLHVDSLLQQAVSHYQQGMIENGDATVATITELTTQLDRLMGLHQESLHTWLTDAANYADNEQDREIYLHNARLQITQWGGPKLKDYASKAWQGMYAGYYLPRWHAYLTALRGASISGAAFNDEAAQALLIQWETNWIADKRIPEKQVPEAPLVIVDSLFNLMQK